MEEVPSGVFVFVVLVFHVGLFLSRDGFASSERLASEQVNIRAAKVNA